MDNEGTMKRPWNTLHQGSPNISNADSNWGSKKVLEDSFHHGLKIETITFLNMLIANIMVYHTCFMKIKVIVNREGFSLGWSVALKHLLSQKKCFLYGFNAKIGYKKYALGPEILAKTSKIMLV